MFLGHFAVGLAAKRAAPKTSLGTLTLAALFLDALWPVFLLFGIERAEITPSSNSFLLLDFTYYPFSHSLLMALVWAALFSIVYFARRAGWKCGKIGQVCSPVAPLWRSSFSPPWPFCSPPDAPRRTA